MSAFINQPAALTEKNRIACPCEKQLLCRPITVLGWHLSTGLGMDLDDASNGLFLRTPADDISAMSRHRGYHSTYNEFVRTQLDGIDINQSVEAL